MWKLPNGKVQRVPKGIQVEDTKYPASIFKPYREERYDSKWYSSTGSTESEVDGEIVKTHTTKKRYTNEKAKDTQTSKVRDAYISEVRRANEMMDFYDAIGDNDTKKVWSDYVIALKNDAKTLKDEVDAAGSYGAIINFNFVWTEAPDHGSI
jgi:hypothetical protein